MVDCHSTSKAKPSVQCVVHVVEVVGLQLVQHRRNRRTKRLRPARRSRAFRFRCTASFRSQRALRFAFPWKPVEGWQVSLIVQSQSGNPVNIVTSNSTVNGVSGTLRPDVNGPITEIGSVDRWFDTSRSHRYRASVAGPERCDWPHLQQHRFFNFQKHPARR